MLHPSDITLKDMFCGCGGSSQGARNVAGVRVKYAMNHWKLAIESHNTNHPDTHHDCADISETHPARYDRTTGLIASPECTNHSPASGNKRKNLNQQEIFQSKVFDAAAVKSRATMWDVPRFAEIHKYEFIITENVVEVRNWVMFDAWLKAMHLLGYKHKCVYLNAQFAHGPNIDGFAPQSRDRIYIVFWKKGNKAPNLEIRPLAPCPRCGVLETFQAWKPKAISKKYGKSGGYVYRCTGCMNEVTPFYYAALNALDLSMPMVKIGERHLHNMEPLCDNTIARIEYGMKKYGLRPTILDQRNRFERVPGTRTRPADEAPLNTQSTQFSSYLFSPFLFSIERSHSKSDPTKSITAPMATQATGQNLAVVAPFLLANRENSTPRGLTDVLHTVATGSHEMLIAPEEGFMTISRGKSKSSDLTGPLPTVSAGGIHSGIVIPPSAILTMRGPRSLDAVTAPLPSQTTTIQNWLMSTAPLLTAYHKTNQASQVTEPTSTIPTNDSIAYLETHNQPNVEDCYFRMLQPTETKRAQGFPDDYVILGSKDKQQKQIGNANPPPTMQLLVQRCVESLL